MLVRAGQGRQVLERSEQTERVPNILKGGEDTIGCPEAIQRVYFNIGSCAEQCWLNHIPDLRATDRRSATTARRRSTSASAGATARASARSRTGWTTWRHSS